MAFTVRHAAALLVLIGGVALSPPMHTGRDDSQAETPAYSAADPAWFEITARRGTLTLSGNTVSNQHEKELRQAVARHFPRLSARTDFHPLGVAPDWWSQATADLVAALAVMQSPTALLRTDTLRVVGIVDDKTTVESRLQTLGNTIPDSVTLDIQLRDVAANATADVACADQFTNLEPGPVNFEESGLAFRPSAYPVLDRIVALADACRNSTVTITGHTDSSGNETWNRQLSLGRAQAVASYLDDRGIDRVRLIVAGAGSSVPVASNSTRYGRGLNRRIEILMASGRPE